MSELYRKKGSPFWYFTLRSTVNGVAGITKETRKVRAQEVLDEKRLKARDHGVVALNRKAPTLAEYSVEFLRWVEDYSRSIRPQTKRFYRHGCGLLLKAKRLADIKLDAITNSDCETATFPGGDCHANQALRTLRRMMSLAKEARLMFGELPKIRTRKVWPRSVAMSLADSELIAAKMTGDARDVFRTLRGTGMRPSECYAMRWEFLSLDRGEYKNPHGKTTTARRSCPLLHDSLATLQRRHLAQGMPREGWVFPSESVNGHVVAIGKAFRAAREAAELPSTLVLYTARHGVGTELVAIVSLKEVMDLLGHSDARTALGYQHPQVATNLHARVDEARTNGRVM